MGDNMTFRSVPWTSQPPKETPVDRSHPLLKNCIFFYSAGNAKESIGGKPSTKGSAYAEVGNSRGLGLTTLANGGVSFPAIPDTICNETTFFAYVYVPALKNTNGSERFVGTSDSVNLSVAGYSGGTTVAFSQYMYPQYSGTHATYANGYLQAGKFYLIVGTFRRNSFIRIYANGTLVSESATTDSAMCLNPQASAVAIGGPEDRSFSLLFSGISTREFSKAEVQQLASNPNQVYQPRKLPIFIDIPVDHNIYAYTDESATTNETSEYPSTGSVFNEGSQDTNSSAESSSVLVNLNAASIEPSTSQESSTSQAALQAVLTESNASQDTQTQGATSSNTTTDTNSVTDSSIKVYTAQTTLNDTNSVVDNQTAQAQLYAARSEVNNAVESISALAQLYAAKTESFAATETSTQGASSSNNTTDSIGVTDSSTKAYIAQATLSDSNTSTDGSTVQAQFYAAKTEVATTLDSLLVQASLLAVKLETASPTDSRTTSSTFAAAQLNTINIIDTYAAIASLTAQLHTISNSIEVLLGSSISSANTIEITTALDDFYTLLEQLIYQLSQVVFMNETPAFTLVPISRTTSLLAEARNTTFNSSIRLNQFLATKPITTYIRT